MSPIRIFTITLCFLSMPLVANAAQSCTQPIEMYSFKKPVPGYCNVYDRQLAYREERLKFRKILEERRVEFIQPQLDAQKAYQKKLEALHESRTHDNDVTGK